MKPREKNDSAADESRIAEPRVEANPPLPRDPLIDPVDPIDPVNVANPAGNVRDNPIENPLESRYRDLRPDPWSAPGSGIAVFALLIAGLLGLFWLFSTPNQPVQTAMNDQRAETIFPRAQQNTEQPAQPEQPPPPANNTTQP